MGEGQGWGSLIAFDVIVMVVIFLLGVEPQEHPVILATGYPGVWSPGAWYADNFHSLFLPLSNHWVRWRAVESGLPSILLWCS